jgi:hypothetical protein
MANQIMSWVNSVSKLNSRGFEHQGLIHDKGGDFALSNNVQAVPKTHQVSHKMEEGKGTVSLCLTKHHAMKTYWGNGVIAPLIL